MNKRQRIRIYTLDGFKPYKYAPNVAREQWRELDAEESGEAISAIAEWHSHDPKFLQFFGVAP
jgi:hypothetical protein